MSSEWIMHKFGGTSLADAAAYRRVAGLIDQKRSGRTAVVVSAMSGVTDALIRLVDRASARDVAYSADLRELLRREREFVGDLLSGSAGERVISGIEADFNDIEDVLRAIWLMRSRPNHAVDIVSGYGELWSARILAAHLESCGRDVTWLDAREILTVRTGELAPIVDWESSRAKIGDWLDGHDEACVIVPGFVAADASGLPTTLGRNGSDYSASIFAALLHARSIQIWTDVDGVLSANPRQVPDAVALEELSYDEAMELAYFGAKVIHPATLAPVLGEGIPVFIRNTFRPELPGTRIHAGSSNDLPVKGFASIDEIALVNLEGTGLIGVPGISERLFGALREASVSVVMISQGSSEHSICFAIPARQAETAREAVERAFLAERHQGQIQKLDVDRECAILAMVGDNMAGTPGIAAKFFGALGRAGVNVRAIAQGSSERNISIVVCGRDTTRALRAVHSGFYLSDQTLSIGVLGPGVVGSTLLSQILGQAERLKSTLKVDLRVRGIATGSRMLLDPRRIDLGDWRGALERNGEPSDLERFAGHIQTETIPHAVLIDCTASESVARSYDTWLRRGLHVITPNKLANASDLDYYRTLRAESRGTTAHYLYETTVGAGLPIIQTLRDLIQTGDEVLRIEGVLSGTLSYLFNSFDGRRPFSDILREARDKGYTEPDPRDDLSGLDVARKVVILAREMGMQLDMTGLEVESLVTPAAGGGSVESFLDGLGEFDAMMLKRFEEARTAGAVLRFVGVVDPVEGSSVRLTSYPLAHPFARIERTDNIVQFRTRRYRENPLIVQGPGAGPEVTAAGVFADLLRLATYLGATF